MPRIKQEVPLSCGHKSFDIGGWEGGIAVYWMDGDHGTKIVAIPKLGLSTCLLGNGHDKPFLMEMLRKNRTFYFNDEQTSYFADDILRSIKGLKVV